MCLFILLSLMILIGPPLAQGPRPVSGRLVLAGGTLINPGTRAVLSHSVILIRGERIEEVGEKEGFQASGDDEVIDCTGKFIIPGLIDVHIHLERWSCDYLISHGVTTVRDCGNWIPLMKHFSDKIQKGEWVGPRIFWGNPAIESAVKDSDKKDPRKIRDPAHAAQLASTGIPAMDVLKIATANAAELLGMKDELGSVEEGRLADLVILDRNPLEDIKNSRRISRVIKSGKIHDPSD